MSAFLSLCPSTFGLIFGFVSNIFNYFGFGRWGYLVPSGHECIIKKSVTECLVFYLFLFFLYMGDNDLVILSLLELLLQLNIILCAFFSG